MRFCDIDDECVNVLGIYLLIGFADWIPTYYLCGMYLV